MITRGNVAQALGNDTVPTTLSHSISGYYRGVIVNVYNRFDYVPTTVTYGGFAMNFVQTTDWGSQYYLENPPIGSNTVSVSFTGGTGGKVVVDAIGYNGVNQTDMINTNAIEVGSSSGISHNLTTTVANCWVATLYSLSNDDEIIANGTNFTLLGSSLYAATRSADSNGPVALGSVTISTTTGDTDGTQSIASVAIAPAILLALLEDAVVSDIALTSARVASEVIYDGDVTITERGFVVGLSTLPTIANGTKFVISGTVGEFEANLSNLAVNTTYYVRPYATNANGTGYGEEATFTTLNIDDNDLIKDIGAVDGENYAVSVNVTGTVGSVTVKLGTTGASLVIAAGSGVEVLEGTYSGNDGLILSRSADFDGTIDDVMWVRVAGEGTIDWSLDTYTTVFPIDSSVTFKRIEDEIFNSGRLYRYLDILFKDRDGFVTVSVTAERDNAQVTRSKTFSVGNSTTPASAFSKRRLSILTKGQALVITLSNAKASETFSIAQFLLHGSQQPQRQYPRSSITSV